MCLAGCFFYYSFVDVRVFHEMFDVFLDLGITFLMKLRSGGLLFREKGSMGDSASARRPSASKKYMPLGALGCILGVFFRSKID